MENRRDYLKRITGMKEIDKDLKPGQKRNLLKAAQNAELNRLEKEYRKFIKCLNYEEERGGRIELIFLYLYRTQNTISSFVNKGYGHQYLLNQILVIYHMSEFYFHYHLLPTYCEEADDMLPKDADINLEDVKRISSAFYSLGDPGSFIRGFENKMVSFLNELYQIIYWICNNAEGVSDLMRSVNEEIDTKPLNSNRQKERNMV